MLTGSRGFPVARDVEGPLGEEGGSVVGTRARGRGFGRGRVDIAVCN